MVVRKNKIAISMNKELLAYCDSVVDKRKIKNRSQAIEYMVRKGMGMQEIRDAVIFVFKHDLIYFQHVHKGSLFLQDMVNFLKEAGIQRVFVLSQHNVDMEVYYKDVDFQGMEVMTKYFSNDIYNLTMLYSIKDELGDTFLVTNGDTLQKFRLSKMLQFAVDTKKLGTILLINSPIAHRYTSIQLEGNDVVKLIERGPTNSSIVYGGSAVLNKKIFDILNPRKDKHMEGQLFPKLVMLKEISGFFNYGEYVHMPELYDKAYRERWKQMVDELFEP